jgi:hypothetical protein
MNKLNPLLVLGGLILGFLQGCQTSSSQESEKIDLKATPEQVWQRLQKTLPPLSIEYLKDEIVSSDSNPSRTLRRLEVRFCSQVAGQWRHRMEHTAVILIPRESQSRLAGKVVVVSHAYDDPTVEGNYGEPIAARMGYPTMVIPIPGEYNGCNGESSWIYYCRALVQDTRDPVNFADFRQAAAYLRALDVFTEVLDLKDITAVIGGHSKRATSAFLAAAMDPKRIAGVVYMETNENKISQVRIGLLRPEICSVPRHLYRSDQ